MSNLHEAFITFVETKWKSDDVYTNRIIANVFHIPLRNARYHMVNLVREGFLTIIIIDGLAYYALREHYAEFVKFRRKGIIVR